MKYNKNQKKNKILILLLLILLLLSLVGCNSQSTNATDTFEVKTIFDSYEEPEKPVDEAERLLKEYSPEYYLRDYTEVKERLNKEAQEFFTELFYEKYEMYEKREDVEGYINDDLKILTEVFLYNKSFYEAEQNNLSFKDIWNNKEEHLKYVNVYIMSFKENIEDSIDEDNRFKAYYRFVQSVVSQDEFSYYHQILGVYDSRVLKELNLNELLKQKDLELISKELERLNVNYQFYINGKKNSMYANQGDAAYRSDMDILKDAYGIEFRPSYFDHPVKTGLYHPVMNRKVDFYGTLVNEFKSAYFQYILSNKVNEILEKHEIDHQVGQFSFVHTNNLQDFDMTSIQEDYDKLIHDEMTTVEITLYVLEVPNETIDFQNVIASISEIQDCFDFESDSKSALSIYVIRYNMESLKNREVILDLFKVYKSSENYIRDTNGMETWAQNMFVVRNETDCFKYLDLVRDDFQKIYRLLKKIEPTHDVNTFFDVYEVDSIFDSIHD